MKFILFDIDGTLIDSGGAGSRALDLAFEEIFSVRDAFRTVSMAGKTDMQIVREGLRFHGIDDSNGVVPDFFEIYAEHLKRNILHSKGHIKPGIREALDVLQSRDRFILGLLTGNIEKGAMIKLDFFGLTSYFTLGAFGSDDEDRNNLLPLAMEKLQKQHSIKMSFKDCVVIGDTPRDIECSKPYGALSIAVATGPYSTEELAEADFVFEDLSDTGRLMSILK